MRDGSIEVERMMQFLYAMYSFSCAFDGVCRDNFGEGSSAHNNVPKKTYERDKLQAGVACSRGPQSSSVQTLTTSLAGRFPMLLSTCLLWAWTISCIQMKQQQLADIAAELQKERDVVARYKDLKFV